MDKELIHCVNHSLKNITNKNFLGTNKVAMIPATKMFLYLEGLFEKTPDGFCKFQSPSKVPSYKVGTSMCEETGWNCATLYQRLNKICTLYKSKGAYMEALERLGNDRIFCGNPYLRYRDHGSYQVYFRRNQRIVTNIMNGVPLTFMYEVPVGRLDISDNCFLLAG